MKTYIFKHSLLGVILGLSILGCTEGDKFDYNKNMAFITGTETTPCNQVCGRRYPFFVCRHCFYY